MTNIRNRYYAFLDRYYYVVAVLLCALFSLGYRTSMSFDVYFMIRQAENMLQYGFDISHDLVSMHSDFAFMNQKWAMCFLCYFIYKFFGHTGFLVGVYIMQFFVNLAMFVLCDKFNKSTYCRTANLFLLVVFSLTANIFSQFRPQQISVLFLIYELYLLESYARSPENTNRMKLYIKMFFISICIMWFHSTMWYLCIIFIMPYLADCRFVNNILKQFRRFSCFVHEDYDAKPVWVSFLVLMLGSLFQPNGLKQYQYMLICMKGSNNGYSYVGELRPFFAYLKYYIAWIVLGTMIVCLLFLYRMYKRKGFIPIREACMLAGSVIFLFMAYRLSQYSIVLFMFVTCLNMCYMPDDMSDKLKASLCDICTTVAVMAGIMFIFVFVGRVSDESIEYDYVHSGRMASDAFVEMTGYDTDTVFFSPGDTGAYMMIYGYKPFFDCRAEIYIMNRDVDDVITEYLYIYHNEEYGSDFVNRLADKYGFEYFMIEKDEHLNDVLSGMDNTKEIYSDDYFVVYSYEPLS